MKYLWTIVDRNHDRSFGFGAIAYFHKHMNEFPFHFHFCITFAFWFIEFHIGKEVPRGED